MGSKVEVRGPVERFRQNCLADYGRQLKHVFRYLTVLCDAVDLPVNADFEVAVERRLAVRAAIDPSGHDVILVGRTEGLLIDGTVLAAIERRAGLADAGAGADLPSRRPNMPQERLRDANSSVLEVNSAPGAGRVRA